MFCSKNGVKSAHGTLTDIVVLSLYPGKRPSREFSSVRYGLLCEAECKKEKKNNWEKCRTQRCRQQSVGLGRCARKMLGKSVGKLTIWQRLTYFDRLSSSCEIWRKWPELFQRERASHKPYQLHNSNSGEQNQKAQIPVVGTIVIWFFLNISKLARARECQSCSSGRRMWAKNVGSERRNLGNLGPTGWSNVSMAWCAINIDTYIKSKVMKSGLQTR